MFQNVIRYASYSTYDPWITVLYLAISLLLFIPLLPVVHFLAKKAVLTKFYWPIAVLLPLGTVFTFFMISNVVLRLAGYYDYLPDEVYARRYFGKEALFHFLILATGFMLLKSRSKNFYKLVSGTLGRKEITISSELIRWIESDDHYLKIHTNEASSLLKRSTLEQMAEELKPNFIRIHRKYLVNRDQIIGKEKQQRDEFVILKTGERLKVGRSYQPINI